MGRPHLFKERAVSGGIIALALGVLEQCGRRRMLLIQVGRVPQRRGEAEVPHVLVHGWRIGELAGLKIEGVDRGGVGPVDPIAAGGEVQVADVVQVTLHLCLIVVFVAPYPRPQRPARRQLGGAGHVVIMPGDVDGCAGAKQVYRQALGRVDGGTEGRFHHVVFLVRHRKYAGVRGGDEQPPAAGADEQRNRNMCLIKLALQLVVVLQLHGPDFAAVIHIVEPLAQAVEALLLVDMGAKAHEGHPLRLLRRQRQHEMVFSSDACAQLGAEPAGVGEPQPQFAFGCLVLDEAGRGGREPLLSRWGDRKAAKARTPDRGCR